VVDDGNLSAVNKFIEAGASVDMRDDKNELTTSIHSCVNRGDITTAQLLIECGVTLSAENIRGESALFCAVVRSPPYDEMVELLVNEGADVAATTRYSETILCAAAAFGTTSIVKFLMDRGANPTIAGSDEHTPLHAAAEVGSAATVRLLLEAGVDIDARDNTNETPLHWAVWELCEETIEVLLQWGANVDATNYQGDTPLNLTLGSWEDQDGVDLIIHHATRRDRGCPNDGACTSSCPYSEYYGTIIGQLLVAGANVRAVNNFGRSPLSWALQSTPA
jgi:ankyrin repeat protein